MDAVELEALKAKLEQELDQTKDEYIKTLEAGILTRDELIEMLHGFPFWKTAIASASGCSLCITITLALAELVSFLKN